MTREEALKKIRQMSLPKETMEILQALAPELAESEDERIRKTLIDALKTSKSVGELKFILPEPTREECLAYLEKQGEQKVSVDDFKAKDWYVSKVDGKIHNIYYSVDKVKPKFKVGDKIIEKNFDECGRGTIIDIKDGKYIFDDGGFICIEEQGLWKLVEQKPAEYIKRNSKEWYSLLAEQYDKGFWKGKAEQKPVEWSEEDEEMFEAFMHKLEVCDLLTNKEIMWAKLRLKSIRQQPKAKLTLLDENIINAAVAFVEQNDHFNYWGGIDKRTVIKALRSLKPHWKPSEEQMKSLDIYRKVPLKHSIDREMLDSLYEQLKKLM